MHRFGKIFKVQRIPITPTNPISQQNQDKLTLLEMEQILGQNTPNLNHDHFENEVCTPYSFTELGEALDKLPNGKSTGYDSIPNELLKNVSFKFKIYLQTFLNRILEDGKVPEALNIGKCMLIFKVIIKIKIPNMFT